MYRQFVFSLAMTGLIGIAVAQAPAPSPSPSPTPRLPLFPSKEKMAAVDALFKNVSQGPILVRGSVQDEKGRPLSGVELSIESFEVDDREGGVVKRERTLPSGSYEVRVEAACNAVLRFYKEGYYMDRIEVSFREPAPDVQVRDGALYYERNAILERERELPPLWNAFQAMELTPDGKAHVFVWAKGDGGKTLESNTTDIGRPYLCIDIAADPGCEGGIRPQPDVDLVYPPGRRYSIALRGGQPGDGLQIYDPGNVQTRHYFTYFDSMSLAPESGYSAEVTIPVVRMLDALELGPQEAPILLYAKVDGKYGKLLVSPVTLLPEQFGGSINIFIDGKGGRNLETRGAW